MKITIPVAILILMVSVIISFLAWVTNKTLNDINANIVTLGIKIDKLTDTRYDHETRLKLIEEKLSIYNK